MKRMMRLCLTLAIVLCLLAAVSMVVGAQTQYQYVSGAAIACDWPEELKVGDPLPEVAVSTPDTGPYTASGSWQDEEGEKLPVGTIVENGKAYFFYIHVEPKEGYLFEAFGCSVFVNGEPMDVIVSDKENDGRSWIGVKKLFSFLIPIDKVELTFQEPVLGQVLPDVQVPEGAKYTANTQWYDVSGEEGVLVNGSVATKTGLYNLTTEVFSAKGYMFTQDTQIFLNGVKVDQGPSEYNYINIWEDICYDFGDPIDKVEVTFQEPELGKPLPEAVIPADANYVIATLWGDSLAAEPDLAPGTIATKAGEYWVFVSMVPKKGYKFTMDTRVWINGEDQTEQCNRPTVENPWHTVISFERLGYSFADVIDEVHLNYAEPTVGKVLPTPALTNAGCELTYWEWYDDVAGEYVAAGTVAQKGHSYKLYCTVEAKTEYQFTEATKVYVNGKLEDLSIDNGKLFYHQSPRYSFATPVEKVELPAIPALKLGDTLPDRSGTGKNYAYVVRAVGMDSDGNQLSGTKVVEGGVYVVAVAAAPADGYEFTEYTNFTVGGKTPSGWAEWSAGNFIDYKVYSFGNENAIEKVDLSAQIPGVGEAGGVVKAVNSYHYRVSGVMWGTSKDGTLENFERISAGNAYQPGQRVMVMVELGAMGDGAYMFVSDLEVTLNGKQYTPIAMLGDPEDLKIVLDLGVAEEKYNGLVVVDGVWGYYEGGVLQTDYTGLVPYGDLIFYVENGILDFTYTGLAWYNDAWTYVANSQLTEGYTGLVWFNNEWFYVVDSVIDWTFTGLVPYEGNYFYVQNNHLDWSYTGLGYHDGGWYFIQNGLLQKEYSGLVYFNDNWFYVEEGVLTYQYFGMVEYEGNLFYVQASHLDWSYTGLGYHEGAWYYFQNALYTPSFTGLVPFNGSLFYVKDGTIDWSFNGEAEYGGTTYTVVNGAVQQ